MLVFSVIFYVGSLVGIILLYVFFTEVSCVAHKHVYTPISIRNSIQLLKTGSKLKLACGNVPLLLSTFSLSSPSQTSSCSLNKFFISSILILGVIVSVVAILPWVQRGKKGSGGFSFQVYVNPSLLLFQSNPSLVSFRPP